MYNSTQALRHELPLDGAVILREVTIASFSLALAETARRPGRGYKR